MVTFSKIMNMQFTNPPALKITVKQDTLQKSLGILFPRLYLVAVNNIGDVQGRLFRRNRGRSGHFASA
jgi:hypothetical protein